MGKEKETEKEKENEKEKEGGKIWSLLRLLDVKFVKKVTYTKESFNNKGNGNQDFSDAHVLSASQRSNNNNNKTSSDENNVDSGKPNQISSHADIKHAPNRPVAQQRPPPPTDTTTSPPPDLSKESFNNKGNEKQDLSCGDISSRNQKPSVLADDDKDDLGWWKKQTTSPLLSSPADINSASSANWNHTLNPPLLSSPDAINNPSSANWNHTLNPPLPSPAGFNNASSANWNHTLNPPLSSPAGFNNPSSANWNHTLNPPRVGVGYNNYPTAPIPQPFNHPTAPIPQPFNHPTAPISQPLPAMQGQLMCNGCKRIWPYPPGTRSVVCPLCKQITYVSPPDMQTQLVPNGYVFPRPCPPSTAGVTYPPYSDDEGTDDLDDEDTDDSDSDDEAKYDVHVFLQMLYGGQIMTIIDGINRRLDYYRILRDLKEECRCDGRVVMDPEFGKVIELCGDRRNIVADFLLEVHLVRKRHLMIHSFIH